MNGPETYRLTLVVPAYDDGPEENPEMDDPLVIALAQLVRDRWHNEQRKRARLVVLPPAGISPPQTGPRRRKSA
jgi:hypothetical protein